MGKCFATVYDLSVLFLTWLAFLDKILLGMEDRHRFCLGLSLLSLSLLSSIFCNSWFLLSGLVTATRDLGLLGFLLVLVTKIENDISAL